MAVLVVLVVLGAACQITMCVLHRKQTSDSIATQRQRQGRAGPLRSDWERVKCGVMERAVAAKFTQHSRLAQKLLVRHASFSLWERVCCTGALSCRYWRYTRALRPRVVHACGL